MSHFETVMRMEAEEKAFPNSTPSQIEVAKAILAEVARAKALHPGNFHSLHEGYGVIKEEVDEFWEEIKRKHPDKERLRTEAIQCAAMFVRFVDELL